MKPAVRYALFFLLPTISALLYPPETLGAGWGVILVAIAFFVFLGVLLLRGNNMALTFSIFVQGMNVIIRLMMFFPHVIDARKNFDLLYMILTTISICLSLWLLFRLDRQDIRQNMH